MEMVFAGIQYSANSKISEQVLKEAYTELGIDFSVNLVPGKRALKLSSSGTVDGELFRIAGLSERYPELIQVPTRINKLEGVYLSHQPSLKLERWEDLQPFIIGIQRGIKFVEKGIAKLTKPRVLTVNNNKQLLLALNQQRIEVAVLARLNALPLIDLKSNTAPVMGDNALVEHALYHYLHEKHRELVPRLDAVLRSMAQTGRIDEIRTAYIQSFSSL